MGSFMGSCLNMRQTKIAVTNEVLFTGEQPLFVSSARHPEEPPQHREPFHRVTVVLIRVDQRATVDRTPQLVVVKSSTLPFRDRLTADQLTSSDRSRAIPPPT